MLTPNDLSAITKVVQGVVTDAVVPLATKEELKTLATREEIKVLATKEDLKSLATKADLAKLDTKITNLDVKMSGQFAQLKDKTTKDTKKLEKAIKKEHRIGNDDFAHLENEDRKVLIRVEKIEHHLGFASA